MLGNGGRRLAGVAVNGLLAAQHHVEGAELFQRLGEDIAGGIGVGAAEGSVRDQIGVVGAHGQRFPQDDLGLGRPHGDDGDLAAVLILQLQRRFHGIHVKGIHDTGHAGADEGLFHRINANFGGIRNLLDTNSYFHMLPPFIN